ncbi:MAG: type II toxin-antitoxin system PemK/MazF family toxin [Chloroflexi bacterium]|nr:type II toxin-antitoxin system PemK/MazF family toxin [Chloroflexota bacterium]
MDSLTAGTVVLIPFPFSDLSRSKLRPAVVVAYVGRDDWILCQVTSKPYSDPRAIEITEQDFEEGSLHVTSYARPGKLFTAHSGIFARHVGRLTYNAFERIVGGIVDILEEAKDTY